jgi:hypothetical protein
MEDSGDHGSMKIYFGQIYVTPDVEFPFTISFQQRLSGEVSALLKPPESFIRRYGADWDVIFRVSAKRAITDNEIRGPSISKKDKNVEFTVFLPFDVIQSADAVSVSAIQYLLRGTCSVLASLEFDVARLQAHQASLADTLSSDPAMFDSE